MKQLEFCQKYSAARPFFNSLLVVSSGDETLRSCLIYYIKSKLTIHVILGESEYAKIKTNVAPKVEDPGEPIAGLTSFGWNIMFPGAETNPSHV